MHPDHVDFEVRVEDDDEIEPDETLIARLKPDSNDIYALGQADPKAEAEIEDNEPHLTGVTVIDGASQEDVIGEDNWAAVKDSGEFVIVEASLDRAVSDEQAAQIVEWNGGEPVNGEPLQRKVCKDEADKTTVKATVGENSDQVNIWVIWSEITIRMAGETSEDSTAKHPEPGFGGQVLGPLTDEDHLLGLTEAIGKIEFVATILPAGVHEVIQTGFNLHQWVTGKWFDNGALTQNIDQEDNPAANRKDLTPNNDDKIFYVDGPTAGLGFDVNHTTEKYNSFSGWVTWNDEVISDSNQGKWHYFARIDDDLDAAHRQADGSGNDDTELNDLGLGNPALPANAHYNPR